MNSNRTKAIAILLLFTVYGCRVTLVPAFDTELAEEISQVSQQFDKFHLELIENEEFREFKNVVNRYIELEVMLNSIHNKNRIKPLNEHSSRISEITLSLFNKYKEEHRNDKTMEIGIAKYNRKVFSDLFFAMLVAERGKELANKPPQ